MLQRFAAVCFVVLASAAISVSCGGGGGEPATIVSLNVTPSTPVAGGVMELTASISAPGQSVSNMVKNWTVSAGTLSASPPQFNLDIRQTAQSIDYSVSTTNNSVYWTAPASTGAVTITLQIDDDTESITTNVTTSPITYTLTSGENETKIVTVRANDVEDLYYAAFRVSFSGNWFPVSVVQGSFMGPVDNTLFIGMINQTGYVPVAVSRRGDVVGEYGSGVLATITFSPVSQETASTSNAQADIPFALKGIVLENSSGEKIQAAY